jgi:plasmid stabilization system protein ParE
VKTLLIDPAARQDLVLTWDYIAKDNVAAADRLVDSLIETCERVARNPGIGHTRPQVAMGRPLRFFPFGSYMIVYVDRSDTVLIVAIIHGARDIPRFIRTRL